MVYNGYDKVMSNSPKMGYLPIPVCYSLPEGTINSTLRRVTVQPTFQVSGPVATSEAVVVDTW